jgi:hypothetical protein
MITPAMIIVVCDIGFLGPVSFGTSLTFSVLTGSLTGAGAGTGFSTVFTGNGGVTFFSAGAGGAGGAAGAATGTVPAGFSCTGAAAGPTGAPQIPQNFISGTSTPPHFGQAVKASIFAPQDSQNFISGINGLPHFGHFWGFSVMNKHLTDLVR